MSHIYLYCCFPKCYWDWNSAYTVQKRHLVQPWSWLLSCIIISITMSNFRKILTGIYVGPSHNLVSIAEPWNISWSLWQTLQYKFTNIFAVSKDIADSKLWMGMITAVGKSRIVGLYLQNQLYHCSCCSACPCKPWQCGQGKSN